MSAPSIQQFKDMIPATWIAAFSAHLDKDYDTDRKAQAEDLFAVIAAIATVDGSKFALSQYLTAIQAIKDYPEGYSCWLDGIGQAIAATPFLEDHSAPEASLITKHRLLAGYQFACAILGAETAQSWTNPPDCQ